MRDQKIDLQVNCHAESDCQCRCTVAVTNLCATLVEACHIRQCTCFGMLGLGSSPGDPTNSLHFSNSCVAPPISQSVPRLIYRQIEQQCGIVLALANLAPVHLLHGDSAKGASWLCHLHVCVTVVTFDSDSSLSTLLRAYRISATTKQPSLSNLRQASKHFHTVPFAALWLTRYYQSSAKLFYLYILASFVLRNHLLPDTG